MLSEIGLEVAGGCVRPLAAKCCVSANLADELSTTLCAPLRYLWLVRRPRVAAEDCWRSSSMLSDGWRCFCMCEIKASVRWLVVCFLLVVYKFIRFLSVVEVGITVIFV